MGIRYMGSKTFTFSSKKLGFFAQKRPNLARNWHFGHFWRGHGGSFGALLVGWLVVVVCELYLTRHLNPVQFCLKYFFHFCYTIYDTVQNLFWLKKIGIANIFGRLHSLKVIPD